MLKDLVLIKHRLITKDKSSFIMSLFNFMASPEDEQNRTYKDLYSLLVDTLDEQSIVEIVGSSSNKVYTSTALHNNLSRYHHLLISITITQSQNEANENVFLISLNYLTGVLGIVLNTTALDAQIEFPDWMGYIETPDALYLPNGIIPVTSGLYKTFKYKQKFFGLRCK